MVTAPALHRQVKPFLRLFWQRALGWLTRTWLPIGKTVVVVGSGLRGCEIAEFLIKRGRRVTIYRDLETGITLVQHEECSGCRSCLEACPYDAPQFHGDKMSLCDLCIHRPAARRREGRYTACEAACPARAIHVTPAGAASGNR